MRFERKWNIQRPSLRSFITITISLIVAVVLLCSTCFFYLRTSRILRDNSRESITNQLNQVNSLITEQIDTIDSVIPLFLSNNLILDALESPQGSGVREDKRFLIERQMSYIYSSTLLSDKNFTDSIYVLCDDDTVFHTYTSGTLENVTDKIRELSEAINTSETGLMCFPLASETGHIYFARNLYNSNTGHHMGILVLNIDSKKFMAYCTKTVNPEWFITLYNSELEILSDTDRASQSRDLKEQITLPNTGITFQEQRLSGEQYYIAARKLGKLNLTSAVAAPKELLLQDLNGTLKSYLLLLCITILVALAAAIIISRTVTRPIDKMVFHINEISNGVQDALPPMKMYREFDTWANAFNDMLEKLDASYNDNFQKQLLLKNAEIRTLQSQINPHFTFNVLNTIAWKAQMLDNEEIYQMVISLGELMRMDILSKNDSFTTLEQEMEYVKLYIYLQQMRFEDKISCTIQIAPKLMQYRVPVLCIQPLVENAIVHGLEPKKGKGRLEIQVLETDEHKMEVNIMDDGIGFQKIPDIPAIYSSVKDEHTHIGLKNLNKRLELLFGESAHLRIQSEPGHYTSVSFTIPIAETK
ncbi:MAG: sensor histidine kinase [Lachnospiraceae bacterium]|nr:sensor histidine kinase [Lachnospiraceae bacterium]